MQDKRIFQAHDGAAIYLYSIIANLAVQMLASIIALATKSATISTTVQLIMMALIQCANIAVYVAYCKIKKTNPCFTAKKVGVAAVLLSVVITLITLLAYTMPAQWWAWGLEKLDYAFNGGLVLSGAGEIVLGVIVTAILAPIGEELIFRGALLSSAVKRLGVVGGVLISGLAFSLMHMNPEQTVYQFFLGCSCGYMVICTGKLTPAIIMHAVNNLIAVGLSFIPTAELGSYALPYPLLALAVTVIAFVGGTAAIIFLGKTQLSSTVGKGGVRAQIAKANELYRGDIEDEDLPHGFTVALVIGLVICLITYLTVFISGII